MRTPWLAICLLLLAGCGAEAPAPGSAPVPDATKPGATIGRVTARLADRPAADRARIEAAWTRSPDACACELSILLPEGVILLEGEATATLDPRAERGAASWLVGHPLDARPRDVVVRLSATEDGARRVAEAYVRVTGR